MARARKCPLPMLRLLCLSLSYFCLCALPKLVKKILFFFRRIDFTDGNTAISPLFLSCRSCRACVHTAEFVRAPPLRIFVVWRLC